MMYRHDKKSNELKSKEIETHVRIYDKADISYQRR